MNKFNVLDLPSSLESLEKDFNDWSLLPYDMQKKSNDACMEKYGCNNIELYNILKARLIQNGSTDNLHEFMVEAKMKFKQAVLVEGFNKESLNNIPGYTANGMVNDRLNKIALSKNYMAFEDDWMIICDFLDDKHPDYTISDLEAMFAKYNSINSDHRRLSDTYSAQIWGRDVPGMYAYMRQKLETMDTVEKDPEFVPDGEDASLSRYIEQVETECQYTDNLNIMIRKLDCLNKNHHRSIYESSVLESYGDTIKVRKKTYREDMPGVLPFLTYTEYLHNTKSLDEKKLKNVDPFTYVFNYKESVESLREMWRNNDTKGLLKAGWNPAIEPTYENMVIARERQIKWFDEHKSFEIVDISKFDSVHEAAPLNSPKSLSPIFLVVASTDPTEDLYNTLKRYTMFKLIRDFHEIGISMSSNLQNIYTFESTKTGEVNKMNIVTLDDFKNREKTTIHVLALFVTSKAKTNIKDSLKYYMMNQDNSIYGFDNVVSIMKDDPKLTKSTKKFNPYLVIGSFLDSIFKISNLYDKIGKQEIGAGLQSKGGKLYVVYTGPAKTYKDSKVDKKIDMIKKNGEYSDLNFFGPNSTVEEYPNPGDFGYYSFDTYLNKYQNESVNEVIDQIREEYLNADNGAFDWTPDSEFVDRDKILDVINTCYSDINILKSSKEPSVINSTLDRLKQNYQYLLPINANYQDYGLTDQDYTEIIGVLDIIAKNIDYNTKYAKAYCNYTEKESSAPISVNHKKFQYTSENFIYGNN